MIIGLCGHKGSGKDTLASQLVGYRRIAFADKLKRSAMIVFDLSDEEMNDPVLKETRLERWPFETPRQILQKMGTDAIRSVWNDVWIEAVRRDLVGNVVVTDVRFLNEAQMIRDAGGIIVKIVRGGQNGDEHVSEREVDNIAYDFLIENNSTVDNLYKSCKMLLEKNGGGLCVGSLV